jgi:adenylate cyclase, class 2
VPPRLRRRPWDISKWARVRRDRAEVAIDSWPLIPPYMEIEAESKDRVIQTAKLLGFDESDLTTEGSHAVYRRDGIDLAAIPALRF